MFLYHTGFVELPEPDIYYGRKNADFGQGFYLTPDKDFSERWAKSRKGCNTYVNCYDFDTEGLKIIRLARDKDWFEYIFRNRRAREDILKDYDVVIGPIANDTIYDVMGILTSGLLEDEQALKLLQIGPEYVQLAIKTEKAVKQLHWISARIMEDEELKACRKIVLEEERKYQEAFAKEFSRMNM